MILGINAHQASRETLQLASSIGAEFVRCDVNWGDVEPERGQFTWDWLDEFIRHATGFGMQVYPTISYSPKWLGERETPPPLVEWKHLISEFGKRYIDKVHYVSIWNEPNFRFAGSVEQYITNLLQPAAEILRSIPGADYKICGPDLSTEGQWRPWLQVLLEKGDQWLDILTVHAYGTPGRKVRDRLLEVKQVMNMAGAGDMSLALTEFGWNTAYISEDQQRNYLDQCLESLQSVNWLLAALYFNLINESTKTQLGLFRDNGTIKPAGEVFKQYARDV